MKNKNEKFKIRFKRQAERHRLKGENRLRV